MHVLPTELTSDSRPANLAFGTGGIAFFLPENIQAEQVGYVGPGWDEAWLVIASESTCGDPLFIDRSRPELPVFTAMHGMGIWDPQCIAPSWATFIAVIDAVRPFAVDREHPVGLWRQPLSSVERLALEQSFQALLGPEVPDFWILLTEAAETF